MKKVLFLLFIATALSTVFAIKTLNVPFVAKAQSNECSNTSSLNLEAIGRCLSEIQKAYELSVKATQPLESQLNSMQKQINGIKERVAIIENDIAVKKENIDEGYKNLERQTKILEATVRDFY